uniref:ABC transporter transmembrane domain-containing protein n=1 Tax=Armatimonas sp. TaxID=1872638 RepID=UPI003751D00E
MAVAESYTPSLSEEADSLLDDKTDPLLLSERADLNEETHHFGERVVQLHKCSVRVYDGAGVLLTRVLLDEIKSARTEALVGGARLELTLKNGTILPLVECTARVSARISELARGIEQLAQGEELAVKLTHQKTRCERCNRLLPEPDGRCPACVQRAAIFRRILSYLGPYRTQACFVITGSLLMAAINTFATPKLTEGITDRVLGPRSGLSLGEGGVQLGLYVGGMLLALLLSAFLQWFKNYNASFLSANIAKDLRASIYRALEHLQLSFFDKRQMGAIVSRVTQDTDRVWGFLVDGVPYLLSGTLTLV